MTSRRPSRSPPTVVRLGARPGVPPSPQPPVRIFLGSEPAQYRAERVFFWALEQVRDPARRYEVHRMRDLPGFRRRRWTTGFTNYRFAVPQLAGGAGRALYNDVDQVYLRDPGELFDADMRGAGYLAASTADTSVMLLDCGRMSAVWTLPDAQRCSKRRLTRRAARARGLFGPLAPEWNARDGAYVPGRSRCLHFTSLAQQPWRPFPDRFVYDDHPAAAVFRDLERAADAGGYQVFSRSAPSPAFGDWLQSRRGEPAFDAALAARWATGEVGIFDPATPPRRRLPVCSAGALDEVPDDDLAWLLDELARASGRLVQLSVRCDAPRRPLRGLGVASPSPRTPAWWTRRFEEAAARHPELHWQLLLQHPDGRRELREAGRHTAPEPPVVWVLADGRPGCAGQARGLADALGWPAEEKRLVFGPAAALHNRWLGASLRGLDVARSSPLHPPWPDLVIAAGRRSAPVAEWVRARSRGATRVVALGRKAGDAADRSDLSVVPRYARLLPHPRRVEVSVPLHDVDAERLAAAAERWKEPLAAWRAPRIAVLVGGKSGQYRFDAAAAARLGTDVAALARAAGGSVWASTSRRTGPRAAAALRTALGAGGAVHVWRDAGGDNPYLGLLALADAFVITGDSESMLAEVLAVGRPVLIYPLSHRPSFAVLGRLRRWVERRARARRPNARGAARPQRGLGYLCARLIDRGYVRPVRDLDALHRELFERGLAQPFGTDVSLGERRPLSEVDAVARRVRALMGAA